MPKSSGIRITIWIDVEPRSGDLPRRWWGGRLKPAREVMPNMPAGQTILAAWVVTKLVITATTIPTIAIIATAHKTCSMVTDPRCRPGAHRRRNTVRSVLDGDLRDVAVDDGDDRCADGSFVHLAAFAAEGNDSLGRQIDFFHLFSIVGLVFCIDRSDKLHGV